MEVPCKSSSPSSGREIERKQREVERRAGREKQRNDGRSGGREVSFYFGFWLRVQTPPKDLGLTGRWKKIWGIGFSGDLGFGRDLGRRWLGERWRIWETTREMTWGKYLVFWGRGDRIRVLRLWWKAAERNAGFKELIDECRNLGKIGGKSNLLKKNRRENGKYGGMWKFYLDEYAYSSLDKIDRKSVV